MISDLQTVYDSAAKSHETMGINTCEVFLQNKVDIVLAKAGPGDTKCSICKQELTNTQSLRAHIINRHMKAKSPFKYQECEETFGSSYALKMHLRKHSSSSKKYRCRICTKEYTTVGHYNEHTATHSGRHFICPCCFKVFQHKKNLKAHQQEACGKRSTEEPAPERGHFNAFTSLFHKSLPS